MVRVESSHLVRRKSAMTRRPGTVRAQPIGQASGQRGIAWCSSGSSAGVTKGTTLPRTLLRIFTPRFLFPDSLTDLRLPASRLGLHPFGGVVRLAVEKCPAADRVAPALSLLKADRDVRARMPVIGQAAEAPGNDRLDKGMERRVAPALAGVLHLPLVDRPEPLLPQLLDADQTPQGHVQLVPLLRDRADLRHRLRQVIRVVLGPVADDPLASGHPRRLAREAVVVGLPDADLAVAAVPRLRHPVLDALPVDILVGRQPVAEAERRVRRLVVGVAERRLLRLGLVLLVGVVPLPLSLDQPFAPAVRDLDAVPAFSAQHPDQQLEVSLELLLPRFPGHRGGLQLDVAPGVIDPALEEQVGSRLDADPAALPRCMFAEAADPAAQPAAAGVDPLLFLLDGDDEVFLQHDREPTQAPGPDQPFDERGLLLDRPGELGLCVRVFLGDLQQAAQPDHPLVFLDRQPRGPTDDFVRRPLRLHPGLQSRVEDPLADLGNRQVRVDAGGERQGLRLAAEAHPVRSSPVLNPPSHVAPVCSPLMLTAGNQPKYERRFCCRRCCFRSWSCHSGHPPSAAASYPACCCASSNTRFAPAITSLVQGIDPNSMQSKNSSRRSCIRLASSVSLTSTFQFMPRQPLYCPDLGSSRLRVTRTRIGWPLLAAWRAT